MLNSKLSSDGITFGEVRSAKGVAPAASAGFETEYLDDG
jgi:hypothetical protein